MSGEKPKNAKSFDDQTPASSSRTGNHDKRPRSLLPTGNNNQNWSPNKPTTCLITAPGPPSGLCTPSNVKTSEQQIIAESSADYHLNPAIFYAENVQYANITPNRACSMLVDWQLSDSNCNKSNEQQSTNDKLQTSNSQMLNVRPPPELSVSPADTLSKPSSSDNLSAFSPLASLSNQPLNDSLTHIHSLQHRHSKKHRKFKQISPLNSPIWPSQYDRPSSQPHSPSSLSVNYVPSPARDRSYSAGCTSSNFVFPATNSNLNNNNNANCSANVIYSSNHSLADKQNSVGSVSPVSSTNEFAIEVETLEKAIKSNDWRVVNKLLNAHCSNLNKVYSSSSMNLNLAANQSSAATTTANKLPTNSMRASLFEKLSDQPQSGTQLHSNQSYTQYRAYSAFNFSACPADKGLRKESADSQLSNNLVGHHGRIESPLFNNVLHLAIEHSSIDVVSLLLRSGFSVNANNQTPMKSLDVWRRRSDSSHESHNHTASTQLNDMMDTGSGPLIYNQMGSRLLYSSREQLVPLLSSPHLLRYVSI